MARTLKPKLDDVQKARIARVEDKYREAGSSGDATRLINSWTAAEGHERKQFEDLITANPNLTGKLLKEAYPNFMVFTTPLLNRERTNFLNRVKSRKDGKQFLLVVVALILIPICCLSTPSNSCSHSFF